MQGAAKGLTDEEEVAFVRAYEAHFEGGDGSSD